MQGKTPVPGYQLLSFKILSLNVEAGLFLWVHHHHSPCHKPAVGRAVIISAFGAHCSCSFRPQMVCLSSVVPTHKCRNVPSSAADERLFHRENCDYYGGWNHSWRIHVATNCNISSHTAPAASKEWQDSSRKVCSLLLVTADFETCQPFAACKARGDDTRTSLLMQNYIFSSFE